MKILSDQKGRESHPLTLSYFSKSGYYDRQRPSRRPWSSVRSLLLFNILYLLVITVKHLDVETAAIFPSRVTLNEL